METTRDDYEHYKGRLEEAQEHMSKLDDTIHDSLADEEYDADVATCEEYIETAKRAIQKTGRGLESFNSPAPDNLTPSQTLSPVNHRQGVPTPSLTHHIKLPPQTRTILGGYRKLGTVLGAVRVLHRQGPVLVSSEQTRVSLRLSRGEAEEFGRGHCCRRRYIQNEENPTTLR
jgi:hypothetical protein